MNPRRRRTAGVLAAAVALTGTALTLAPAPAEAASRITVRNDRGGSEADATYQTALTITGSGFQVVEGGFGGVYLMFGWVDDAAGGSWRPSKGGLTGEDYRYIPDSENAADNQGYLTFIAFPGSSTESEANAVLSPRGGFTVDLTVPGPTFVSVDREGNTSEVDCREVTCGVITIGAHGVKNPANETFTPVSFGDVYGGDAPTATPTDDPTPTDTATTGSGTTGGSTSGGATDTPTTRPVRRGKPAIVTDRATAVAGHALAFTGTGFTPGEQVLAILDDGVIALGPMVAGASGEVAGLMQLPVDLGAGTHELRLVGAASGAQPNEMFPVRTATAPAAASPAEPDDDSAVAARVFLGVAILAFLVALAGTLVRLRRRRRTRPAPAAHTAPPAAPATPAAPAAGAAS